MAKIKKLLEERVKSGEAAVKEEKRSWKKVREIWKKLERILRARRRGEIFKRRERPKMTLS